MRQNLQQMQLPSQPRLRRSASKFVFLMTEPGFANDILPRLGEPWLTSRPASGDMTAKSGMGLGFLLPKPCLREPVDK